MPARIYYTLASKTDENIKKEFKIEQAEYILNMRDNGGFKLEEEHYEFKDGKISRRAD